MDTWQEIESLGFYPALVERSLRRACGGREPVAALSQLDAAFDQGHMFRHLTVAALTRTHIVQVHVDELDDGQAMVATALAPVTGVRGISVLEVVAEPARAGGGSPTEVSIAVDMGGQRRGEVEPLHCDDPECQADHGFGLTSVPDDLSIRVSATADGEDSLSKAEEFVDVLTRILANDHE